MYNSDDGSTKADIAFIYAEMGNIFRLAINNFIMRIT
jgi:hypothetical protein